MAGSIEGTIAKLEKVVKDFAALPPMLRVAVGRKKGKGSPEVVEEHTKVLAPEVLMVDRPAVVKTSVGLTISLGNFEFARVDAGIEWPCNPDDIPATFPKAWKAVEDEVKKQADAVKSSKS